MPRTIDTGDTHAYEWPHDKLTGGRIGRQPEQRLKAASLWDPQIQSLTYRLHEFGVNISSTNKPTGEFEGAFKEANTLTLSEGKFKEVSHIVELVDKIRKEDQIRQEDKQILSQLKGWLLNKTSKPNTITPADYRCIHLVHLTVVILAHVVDTAHAVYLKGTYAGPSATYLFQHLDSLTSGENISDADLERIYEHVVGHAKHFKYKGGSGPPTKLQACHKEYGQMYLKPKP